MNNSNDRELTFDDILRYVASDAAQDAGAGPFGLMLACELGRRGIGCLLIDPKTRIADVAQANATQARTMEHFRRLGLAAEIRALGLRMALSSKAKDGLVVLDSLELKDAKTKALKGHFDKAGWSGKVLVIGGESLDEGFAKAARNLPHVNLLPAIGANVYDILQHDVLAVTRAGVAALAARLNLEGAA